MTLDIEYVTLKLYKQREHEAEKLAEQKRTNDTTREENQKQKRPFSAIVRDIKNNR